MKLLEFGLRNQASSRCKSVITQQSKITEDLIEQYDKAVTIPIESLKN